MDSFVSPHASMSMQSHEHMMKGIGGTASAAHLNDGQGAENLLFKDQMRAVNGISASKHTNNTTSNPNLNFMLSARETEESQFEDHMLSVSDLQRKYQFDLQAGLRSKDANIKLGNTTTANPAGGQTATGSSSNAKYHEQVTKQQGQAKNFLFKEFLIAFHVAMFGAGVIFLIAYSDDFYNEDQSNILLGILLIILACANQCASACEKPSHAQVNAAIPSSARVVRDGNEIVIPSSNVVEGDLVILRESETIPVDLRILEIAPGTLRISNGVFATARSDVSGSSEVSNDRIATLECTNASRYVLSRNIAMQGMKVASGNAKGVAVRRSRTSYVGKYYSQAVSVSAQQEQPLKNELKSFVEFSSVIALLFGIAFVLIIKYAMDQSTLSSFMYGATVTIAVAPKGLLILVKIAKRVAAAKYASACSMSSKLFSFTMFEKSAEILSQVSCVCGDLSVLSAPTASESLREVTSVWVDKRRLHVASAKNPADASHASFSLAACAILTSPKQAEGGNAIDSAVARYFEGSANLVNERYSIVRNSGSPCVIQFDSNTGISLAIAESVRVNSNNVGGSQINATNVSSGNRVLFIKGNPHRIWDLCTHVELNGVVTVIAQNVNEEFLESVKKFMGNGDSVVGLARMELPRDVQQYQSGNYLNASGKLAIELNNLTFLGLVAVSNPVGSGVKQSLALSQSSGVKLVILSKESAITAAAVARSAGLIDSSALIDEDQSYSTSNGGQNDTGRFLQSVKNASQIVVRGSRIQALLSQQTRESEAAVQEMLQKSVCVVAQMPDTETSMKVMGLLRSDGETVAVVAKTLDHISNAHVSFSVNGANENSSNATAPGLLKELVDINLKWRSDGKCVLQSVLDAIEVSRGFAENLKKVFVFAGIGQMAGILPIFAFIILGIPLAVSPMYMVLLSTVFSVIPAIALASEDPDIDSMIGNSVRRGNRGAKKIASMKSIVLAYLVLGWLACAAGFCAYYTTMNHFGFPVEQLFGLATQKAYVPDRKLVMHMGYDEDVIADYLEKVIPYASSSVERTPAGTPLNYKMLEWDSFIMRPRGNCISDVEGLHLKGRPIDWWDLRLRKTDLRRIVLHCDEGDMKWKTVQEWSYCDVNDEINYSSHSDSVCYTSDALNYAQTSYFLAVITFQFMGLLAVKSLQRSFVFTRMNWLLLAQIVLQIAMGLFVVEIPEVQKVFRAKSLPFWQWGIPAAPFAGMVLIQEEVRKFLLQKSLWFKKNLAV